MRTTFAATMVLAGLGVLGTAVETSAQKVAYLDSRRIMREVPGGQEVEAQIQQEGQRLETRLQAMRDSLQRMVDDYQRQSVLLSPDEKKKREDAINQRNAAMTQRAQILREEWGNRQQELMDPILQKIEDVIEVIRKEGGYGLIFDAASQVLVSADTTLDLTNQVITRLKANQPGTAGRSSGGARPPGGTN